MPEYTLDVRYEDADEAKTKSKMEMTITSESEDQAKESATAAIEQFGGTIIKVKIVATSASREETDRKVWEAGYEAGEESLKADYYHAFDEIEGWPEDIDATMPTVLAEYVKARMRDIEILRNQVIEFRDELQGAHNDVREAGH